LKSKKKAVTLPTALEITGTNAYVIKFSPMNFSMTGWRGGHGWFVARGSRRVGYAESAQYGLIVPPHASQWHAVALAMDCTAELSPNMERPTSAPTVAMIVPALAQRVNAVAPPDGHSIYAGMWSSPDTGHSRESAA